MKFGYSFQDRLMKEIEEIKPSVRAYLHRPGSLTEQELVELVGRPVDDIEGLALNNVFHILTYSNHRGQEYAAQAVYRGEVAMVIVNCDVGHWRIPGLDMPLVMHKVAQSTFVVNGDIIRPMVWAMTTPGTMSKIGGIMATTVPPVQGCAFEQFETYTLNVDNSLMMIEKGVPRLHQTGDGDLYDALVESGVLAENPNVKYLYVVDCRSLMTSFDPFILHEHIESIIHDKESVKRELTLEVVNAREGDRGRYVFGVYRDSEFMLDDYEFGGDVSNGVISTGNMVVNVDALKRIGSLPWKRKRNASDGAVKVEYIRSLASLSRLIDRQHIAYVKRKFDHRVYVNDEADLEHASALLKSRK